MIPAIHPYPYSNDWVQAEYCGLIFLGRTTAEVYKWLIEVGAYEH